MFFILSASGHLIFKTKIIKTILDAERSFGRSRNKLQSLLWHSIHHTIQLTGRSAATAAALLHMLRKHMIMIAMWQMNQLIIDGNFKDPSHDEHLALNSEVWKIRSINFHLHVFCSTLPLDAISTLISYSTICRWPASIFFFLFFTSCQYRSGW